VYDDMESDTHISSSAGIVCFDSATGNVRWKRFLVRRMPEKFTLRVSARYGRKIRIYSTPPTVKNGVVYHTTNCGLVAALDALSGQVRWATRYPTIPGAHDRENGKFSRALYRNRPPLVLNGRVYFTPVDTSLLLCVDAATGRVLWSSPWGSIRAWRHAGGRGGHVGIPRGCHSPSIVNLTGVTAKGELLMTGTHYSLIDPKTGKALWGYSPRGPYRFSRDRRPSPPLRGEPLLTTDGRAHFTGMWRDVASQTVLALNDRKQHAERWFYGPGSLAETAEPPAYQQHFRPVNRLTLRKYGVTFEIEASRNSLSCRYDVGKVRKAVAKDKSPMGRYALGELNIVTGQYKQAVDLLENARSALGLEEAGFRAEVNQQLFSLYEYQAQAAIQLAQPAEAEQYCRRMATACTTGRDEIKTILSLAETFEKQGKHTAAAKCLESVIKHYGPVLFAVPSLLVGDQEASKKEAGDLLDGIAAGGPKHFFGEEVTHALAAVKTSIGNYFSIISPLETDLEVETARFASDWLRRLLGKVPAKYKNEFEAHARAEFGKHATSTDPRICARLIRRFPETRPAQEALDRLIAAARKKPDPAKRIALWKCNDIGHINGLKVPADLEALCQVKVERREPAALADAYENVSTELKVDPNTKLLILRHGGTQPLAPGRLFIGARSKRIHGNKFGVICWDLAKNKERWRKMELRLRGKGQEKGFGRYFLRRGRVVVHGRYDVLALDQNDGAVAWRFRVPFGFQIEHAESVEDLIVLCGREQTIAIHHMDGQVIWESNETGVPYCRPFLRDNVLILVRTSPSGVVFRSLGTGRLLGRQSLPPLTPARGHPIFGRLARGVPVSFDGENLLLTDGWDYIVVDTANRKVRWQARIQSVDHSVASPIPFRLWMCGPHMFALKKRYDDYELEAYETKTGRRLWGKENEKNQLPLHSVVCDETNAWGLLHSKDARTVRIIGFGRSSGKMAKGADWERRDYKDPAASLTGSTHGDHLVARVKDRQMFELLAFNRRTGKLTHRLALKGFGQWGEHGDVSCAVQGKHLALLSGVKLAVARPK
jgi:outer membrane protein assembly factor BamB